MNSDPKVSVIVAVYNTSIDLLKRALDSVIHQTYKYVELVVIDDGSNESFEGWEYIDFLRRTENCRILSYRKEENKGKSDSLNIGLRIATGDYFCLLDHDDYLKPDYIEKMVDCAIKENADLVAGGMELVDSKGRMIAKFPDDEKAYDKEGFPWSAPANLARMYNRKMVIDENIIYPVGCWTEDIIFTAQAYYVFGSVATLRYRGYMNYTNPLSVSRSRGYYGLNEGKIPFELINSIIEKNIVNRKPYISGILINELMLIEYSLTLYSTMSDYKKISERISFYMNKLQCTDEELSYYQSIVNEDLVIKTMERIFLISYNIGLWKIITPVIRTMMRLFYFFKQAK